MLRNNNKKSVKLFKFENNLESNSYIWNFRRYITLFIVIYIFIINVITENEKLNFEC